MMNTTSRPLLKLQNPEQLKTVIDQLEVKLVNIKRGIEELLLSLNANDKVSWPALLSKAASLSADLSSVQASFKKPILQASNDDAAQYLKSQLVLPHIISPDINPSLLEMTEHRVGCWNHETAPLFLRTKLPLEVEKEINELEHDTTNNQRLLEQATKQISAMNKHLDTIISHMQDQINRSIRGLEHKKVTYNSQHTDQLIRMLYNGEGIKNSSR